jgi:hypothetical protein
VTPSSQNIAILLPLAAALTATCATIVIHSLALMTIVHFVRHERLLGRAGVRFWKDLGIVAGATLIAFAAHLIEIAIWALLFVLGGEFSHIASALYNSALIYTSLAYGDVIMSSSWRLLGPLETTDGMLMFGLSTAMIFAVIQKLIQIRFHELTGA